jgi:hypothetical protein
LIFSVWWEGRGPCEQSSLLNLSTDVDVGTTGKGATMYVSRRSVQ